MILWLSALVPLASLAGVGLFAGAALFLSTFLVTSSIGLNNSLFVVVSLWFVLFTAPLAGWAAASMIEYAAGEQKTKKRLFEQFGVLLGVVFVFSFDMPLRVLEAALAVELRGGVPVHAGFLLSCFGAALSSAAVVVAVLLLTVAVFEFPALLFSRGWRQNFALPLAALRPLILFLLVALLWNHLGSFFFAELAPLDLLQSGGR